MELSLCDILETNDGGRTWKFRSKQFAPLDAIEFLDAQNGFAFGRSGSSTTIVVATADGGKTWRSQSVNSIRLDDIHFVSPRRGFAIANHTGVIFQTTDGGEGWVFNYGSPACSFSSIDFPTAMDGWAAGGGPNGPCLYRTTDGGASWAASFIGAESAPVAAAFRDFVREERSFSQRELISQVEGNCGLHSSIQFVSPSAGWLLVGCQGFFSGGYALLKTSDVGAAWQYAWGPTGCLMGCQAGGYGSQPLFFLDALHVWRQAPGHTIEVSTDGGATWTAGEPPDDPQQGPCCNSVLFVDALHGWMILGNGHTIAITDDGGRTWTQQPVTIVP